MTMPGETLVAAATTEKKVVGKGKARRESRDGGEGRQSDRRAFAREESRQSRFSIAADFFITAK